LVITENIFLSFLYEHIIQATIKLFCVHKKGYYF